jgi:hypothetical protein
MNFYTSPTTSLIRCLYLIQGKASNVCKYLFLRARGSDIFGLSYDRYTTGFDFLPKSTFATGRNHLYQYALTKANDFDYFIFLDDDVEFSRGSFQKMEDNLARVRPTIAVPLTEKTRLTAIGVEIRGIVRPAVRQQLLHYNDEQYLAISRSALQDALILPYLTDWDQESWFVCCLIQEALIQHYYFGKAYQFNDCEISNNQHSGEYPHNLDFARNTYTRWMKEHFPEGTKRPANYQCTLRLGGNMRSQLQSLKSTLVALIKRSSTYRRLRGNPKW